MHLEPNFGGLPLKIRVAIASVGWRFVYAVKNRNLSLLGRGKRTVPRLSASFSVVDGVIDVLADSNTE